MGPSVAFRFLVPVVGGIANLVPASYQPGLQRGFTLNRTIPLTGVVIRIVPTRSVESQRVRLRGSTIAARPTPWPIPATAAAPEPKTDLRQWSGPIRACSAVAETTRDAFSSATASAIARFMQPAWDSQARWRAIGCARAAHAPRAFANGRAHGAPLAHMRQRGVECCLCSPIYASRCERRAEMAGGHGGRWWCAAQRWRPDGGNGGDGGQRGHERRWRRQRWRS